MNLSPVLFEHGSRLHFFIDPGHPQEVRNTLEDWVRAIRGAHLKESATPSEALDIWLMSASGKLKTTGGHVLSITPWHQDLFGAQETRQDFDAVLEIKDGESPFFLLISEFLKLYLDDQGKTNVILAQKHQRLFEKAWKASFKNVTVGHHEEFLKLFSSYIAVLPEISVPAGLLMLEDALERLAKNLDRKKNWRLFRVGDSVGVEPFYFLGKVDGVPVFLQHLAKSSTDLEVCAQGLILATLIKLVKRWEKREEHAGPGSMVKEAFEHVTIPMLLLNAQGSVLQHNMAFGRMNMAPSETQGLADLEHLRRGGDQWTVRRQEVEGVFGKGVLFSFLNENQNALVSGGQELGIITSSIAHELNNPLAGLLVALDLMSMEPEWDDESRSMLKEMKQGALRCKQLVETFLGFSRMNPEESKPGKKILTSSFEQAVHLQRFRMVESGLNLGLRFDQVHPYSYPLHPATFTMLAYLVLGEIMTAYQHLKLLQRNATSGEILEIRVHEEADHFLVTTPASDLKFTPASKLIQYLLQQEKLAVNVSPAGIIEFRRQNVLI